jgi:hypothetical protein
MAGDGDSWGAPRQTTIMSETLDQRLTVRADVGGFDEGEVAGADEPVRRYFGAAIAPGTPLARAARLRMRGSIRLGNRWIPFRAEELLAPLHGYYWPAKVAGGLLRGSDAYVDGHGSMLWKLLGLVPIVHADGPDVARSAMARAVAEGIWLPTALLPRYGVVWSAQTDEHIVADIPIGGELVTLQVTIDSDGHVRSDHLDRWNDPDGTGTFGWSPFGVEATASHAFPCGITMPADGVGGWFQGTDRWHEGQFMRYSISGITLV